MRSLVCRVEEYNYSNRRDIIGKSPWKYYKPLGQVRNGEAYLVRIPGFRKAFEHESFSGHLDKRYPHSYALEGRISSIRKSGKGMYFIDLYQDSNRVQVMANNSLMGMSKEEFGVKHEFLRKGDYINCVGYPSRTKVGELTLKLNRAIQVVSPCLNLTSLPEKLEDHKLIKHNRVLNYIVNEKLRQQIIVRSLIIQCIRQFLSEKGFLEVQTPMLGGVSTGANAEAFRTVLNALSSSTSDLMTHLYLRVAPEIWLKKLVVGGFEKVFEIGQNFRNEGIDRTHNPEFTTCEFYQSFTTLDELMRLTESLLASIFLLLESKNIPLLKERLESLQALTRGQFPRYEFIPTLEARSGLKLPQNLTSDTLIDYHKALKVELPCSKSPASLLDNLALIFLESISEDTDDPIFIYNHPAVMSPLAKSCAVVLDDRIYDVSLRFELFIKGKEYVNAYEEENSPFSQGAKFEQQREAMFKYNDKEMLVPDWEYVRLMEYGLPPTGGWGCGIDRLCMLFSGSDRIEDVLSFGNVRDVLKQ